MRWCFSLLSLGLAVAVATPAIAQPAAPEQAQQGSEQGYEALTRGPVHEAFAEPLSLNSKATAVVPKKPPELIEEVPPDSKPAGAEWISGYWNWDDERNDFIWVSGVWRVPPAGQRWVAGYWTQADDGYRRVNGFWTSAQADSVTYLPEPPETQEAGPTSEAPGENYFWIPGCWQYRDYRYAWRPGFWSRGYDNWVWTPQHYIWTPRGAVFINGYWDYPLVGRGLLFAPVYFNRPIYRNRGFYYSPGIVINAGGLQFSLFARPNYRSYYFGDYYGDRYARGGYYPWYAARQWGGYDPLYHYHWAHDGHHSRDWENRIRDRYRYFNDHQDARPARTLARKQRQ
jgi:hypothetical protein